MKKVVLVLLLVGASLWAAVPRFVLSDKDDFLPIVEESSMETHHHCSKEGGSTAFALAVSEEIENQSGRFEIILFASSSR